MGIGVSFGGDETKLITVIVTQLWEYTKNHWTGLVRWVNGTVSGILFQYRGSYVQKNRFQYQSRRRYLGINTKNVALHFIHGVKAIGHGAQVQPFENHLVLGESSCNTRHVRNPPTSRGFQEQEGSWLSFSEHLLLYALPWFQHCPCSPAQEMSAVFIWSVQNRTPFLLKIASWISTGGTITLIPWDGLEGASGKAANSLQQPRRWHRTYTRDSVQKGSESWADGYTDRRRTESGSPPLRKSYSGYPRGSEADISRNLLVLFLPETSFFSDGLSHKIFATDSLLSHGHSVVERKLNPGAPTPRPSS